MKDKSPIGKTFPLLANGDIQVGIYNSDSGEFPYEMSLQINGNTYDAIDSWGIEKFSKKELTKGLKFLVSELKADLSKKLQDLCIIY